MGKNTTVYMNDEQANWLERHPEINVSGLVRELLAVYIEMDGVK